ncbi:3-deoxy-D-manno-octulosonate 8-phosphate phosphatase [Helicobacter sp. 12S02232-10]|uniref:KdsC family phosphatase n=1 Tax=Helicobacter sp. 12S02232-10 TaxID=1476197 RepID=UPI000BA56D4B|nr:HAD family hydrolase [Helicobacter sp. 12S02232-10]PAF47643.1 3-deoxy-D-manno-octulosonate 8-phosphate phosphatase [Helicobacter sp. 12S02232-10]
MIELILLDVDGTLTNGELIYNQDLVESKSFNIKDGLGLVVWQKLGKKVAVISGRHSEITAFRMKELGITSVYMGIVDKGKIASELKKELGLKSCEVACIGDDLNDLGMFKECGLRFAPSDSAEWIKGFVDVVLCASGGKGAVREMIEHILIRDGLKDEVLKFY